LPDAIIFIIFRIWSNCLVSCLTACTFVPEPAAIRRLAELAFQVNEGTENIGARRLYTVLEKLLESISFDAGTRSVGRIVIDAAYVDARLAELAKNEDLARYVL